MLERPKSSAADIYKRLLRYARPHSRVIVAALLATVVHAGVDALVPLLLEQVIERLQDVGRSSERPWLIPLAIVLIFPLRGVMDFLAVYGLGWAGRSVVRDLRAELFDRYLELPASYFDRSSTGRLISKVAYDCEQVAEAISSAIVVLVRDTLSILLLLGVMIYMSPQLTLLVAVLVPTIGVLVSYMSKALRRYGARIQTSIGDVTRIAEQSLQGHKVIKVFGGEEREQAEFEKINHRNFAMNTRLVAVRAFGDSLTQYAIAIGIALVMFTAISGWLLVDLDAPAFVGFLAAMGMLFAPLKRLTNVNAALQRGIAAGDSVFQTLDEPIEAETGTEAVERVRGNIEYRNVSFRYRGTGEQVLDNVSVVVPAGTTLALVGQSGSGKSTLMSLLPRFYPIDEGCILLDSKDIRAYRLKDLRRQFSLVGQDTILFDDSIANNIAYGALAKFTRADIERAAEAAYVSEFASALPGGLDARAGERGVLLSGGQRQRVAIARALLKDAPVLLLDEATSALDTESERRVLDALGNLMRGRTTLVIAHRLSTVENAHRIAVMKDGRIVEEGSHAQLLSRGGYYATLYGMQFAEAVPAT